MSGLWERAVADDEYQALDPLLTELEGETTPLPAIQAYYTRIGREELDRLGRVAKSVGDQPPAEFEVVTDDPKNSWHVYEMGQVNLGVDAIGPRESFPTTRDWLAQFEAHFWHEFGHELFSHFHEPPGRARGRDCGESARGSTDQTWRRSYRTWVASRGGNGAAARPAENPSAHAPDAQSRPIVELGDYAQAGFDLAAHNEQGRIARLEDARRLGSQRITRARLLGNPFDPNDRASSARQTSEALEDQRRLADKLGKSKTLKVLFKIGGTAPDVAEGGSKVASGENVIETTFRTAGSIGGGIIGFGMGSNCGRFGLGCGLALGWAGSELGGNLGGAAYGVADWAYQRHAEPAPRRTRGFILRTIRCLAPRAC